MAEGSSRPSTSSSTAFVSGSISSMLTNFALQPFDTVKTRVIAGGSNLGRSASNVTQYRGMSSAFVHIVKDEGVISLWKGTVPTMIRVGVGAGLYFMLLNELLPPKDPTASTASSSDYSAWRIGLSAAFARQTAAMLVYPVTVVKTRFEAARGNKPYNGVADALRSIKQTEGVKALYAGLIPTIIRDAPFSGVYMVLYTQCKGVLESFRYVMPQFRPDHPVAQFSAGFVAGGIATVMTQPADVLRTFMQLNRDNLAANRIRTAAAAVYQSDGWRGFFRGSLPRVLKRSIANGITWALFEQLVQVSKAVSPSA